MTNFDFGFYLSLLRKRAPLILIIFLLVSTAGLVLAFVLPPAYQATAKLLVESAQIPTDLARSTVPTGAMEQFQIIQEDVLSRENLMKLAKDYRLFSVAELLSPDKVIDQMKERIVIQPVMIDGAGSRSNIFEVSFTARDPDLAAEVTNRLVAMILDKDTELRTARATDTVQFFTQEAARLDGELKKVDASILKFKNEHINALPDSLEFRRGLQSAQQQRLLVLAQERATLQDRMTDLTSRPLASRSEPVTPEQKALEEMRTALASQLETFSEESPTVVAIRARIAALQKQILDAASAAASAKPDDAPSALSTPDPEMTSTVYRMRSVDQESNALNKSLEELDVSIKATPINEVTLNALERNHQNLQAQYDSAVTRLAEASTGQQIELRLKGERLSLIESAVPPQSQISPKRNLIVIGALAAALALSGAVVILPEMLNRRIRRPIELVQKLDIRPLVTIPYITPPPLARFRRQLRSITRSTPSGFRNVFRPRSHAAKTTVPDRKAFLES